MMRKRSFKFALAAALAALLALAAVGSALAATTYWIDNADPTWLARQQAAHAGTLSDPYEISTAAELAAIAKLYSTQSQTALNGKTIVLSNDIDLSAHEWVPIGYWNGANDTSMFTGSLDGLGHRVTGLRITEMSSSLAPKLMSCGYGLFGEAGGGNADRATIHNLYIEGRIIGNNKNEYGGLVLGSTNGTNITNVVTSGEVRISNALPASGGVSQGRAYAGGLVGVGTFDLLRNCVTYASMSTNGAYTNYAGGMTGYASAHGASVFENCVSLSRETVTLDFNDKSKVIPGGGVCMGMVNSQAMNCAFLTGGAKQPTTGGAGYATVDAKGITRESEVPVTAVLLDSAALRGTYQTSTDVTIPLALYPSGGTTAGLKAEWTFAEADVTVIPANDGSGAVRVRAADPGTKHFTVEVTLPNATMTPVSLKGTVTFSEARPATDITVAPTAVSVERGKTAVLTATPTPANTTDTITWSSSNTAVATVSQNGTVTAVSVGSATITAKAGSVSDTCVVTVTPPEDPTQPTDPVGPVIIDDDDRDVIREDTGLDSGASVESIADSNSTRTTDRATAGQYLGSESDQNVASVVITKTKSDLDAMVFYLAFDLKNGMKTVGGDPVTPPSSLNEAVRNFSFWIAFGSRKIDLFGEYDANELREIFKVGRIGASAELDAQASESMIEVDPDVVLVSKAGAKLPNDADWSDGTYAVRLSDDGSYLCLYDSTGTAKITAALTARTEPRPYNDGSSGSCDTGAGLAAMAALGAAALLRGRKK